jgi:hypothetical protein
VPGGTAVFGRVWWPRYDSEHVSTAGQTIGYCEATVSLTVRQLLAHRNVNALRCERIVSRDCVTRCHPVFGPRFGPILAAPPNLNIVRRLLYFNSKH